MKIIESDVIIKSVSILEWVEAMEQALLASLEDNILMPKRMHLDYDDNTFLLMPCIKDEYVCTKLVSYCPGNKEIGKPSINAILVLNDSETGEPLAVMDGSIITALRTAAVGCIGIKYLAPAEINYLGIIGTGLQGLYQAIFASTLRNINEIWIYDKSENSLKGFIDKIISIFPGISLHVANGSREVCSYSQVIISATNSVSPVFPDDQDLFTGKTFIGIGSYKPECMEYPKSFFKHLDQIFVDTEHAKSESGDLITPVANKWIRENNIYPIAKLISGDQPLSGNQTRFFKSVGVALFDLYAARLVYEKLTDE